MNAITRVTQCWPVHARFDGPIVMIGFGSIGRGTLPLIERHIGFDRSKFVVIAPDDQNRDLLDGRRLRFIDAAVTKENFRDVLAPLLTGGPGRGMIINLSVDTSSAELMEFAKDIDAFYIDTVVEPWPGLYTDRTLSPSARSNYALREGILDLRRRRPGGITALSCCGANPGMVSWMVKQALLDLARDLDIAHNEPRSREAWGQLMRRVGVKGIHIAERDTQRAPFPSRTASSSIPGRSKDLSPRAYSPPSWVGARMKRVSRRTDIITSSAVTLRFTSCGPAPGRACVRGRRRRRPSTAG
jgi:homospermidine synthase